MSLVYAVDPGTLQSALVVLEPTPDGCRVREHHTALNAVILAKLHCAPLGARLVCEQMAGMGMPVGYESFETTWWSGRFHETWPNEDRWRLTRREIKLHLCGTMQAKDANVRQALLDRFGPGKELAIGTIRKKGPLYGLRQHDFAALAVGITWLETHGAARVQPVRPDAASNGILLEDSRGSTHETLPLLSQEELQRKSS